MKNIPPDSAKIKACLGCGVPVVLPKHGGSRKWCRVCAAEGVRKSNRESMRKKSGTIVIYACIDCGAHIDGYKGRKRCHRCARIAQVEQCNDSHRRLRKDPEWVDAWRKKNGITVFDSCIDCGASLPGRGTRKRCPECARLARLEQDKKRNRKNREDPAWVEAKNKRARERFHEHYHNDPVFRANINGKVKKRGGGYATVENIYALLERDGPFCGICYDLIPFREVFAYGEKPIDGKAVHVHHLHPLSKGGDKKDISNMVLAHARCNISLGNRIMAA